MLLSGPVTASFRKNAAIMSHPAMDSIQNPVKIEIPRRDYNNNQSTWREDNELPSSDGESGIICRVTKIQVHIHFHVAVTTESGHRLIMNPHLEPANCAPAVI